MSNITVAYSFIGELPNYIIDCIHQCRLFHKNNIYLIINDFNSPYLEALVNKYNVILINYNELIKDNEYIKQLSVNFDKFLVVEKLNDRSLLFYRSFERIFLIHLLMEQLNLSNVLFMEIDNTIYNNPDKWLQSFSKKEVAFMNCNFEHCSSGIMYIKNKTSLCNILDFMLYYINNNMDSLYCEMRCFFKFIYNNNLNDSSMCQLLPITFDKTLSLFNNSEVIRNCYKNCDDYDGIFDPASYGQYLAGEDLIHTNGQLVLYKDNQDAIIKTSKYLYEWKEEDGLRRPFIYNEQKNEWVLINNLHVHSKHLYLVLSKPL